MPNPMVPLALVLFASVDPALLPAPPPAHADQQLVRASGLRTRGETRALVGKVATVLGVLAVAAGTVMLAEPDECHFHDEDREHWRGLTDRERCRIAGGVAAGVGLVGAGIGGWLWSTGSSMQDEAARLERTQPAPAPVGVRIDRDGARATLAWRF